MLSEDLPASFAVWAASKEAEFLHGRFVWASWDVDEISRGEVRKCIDENPNYLRIGVNGLKGAYRAKHQHISSLSTEQSLI